jgi:hypothetical protein
MNQLTVKQQYATLINEVMSQHRPVTRKPHSCSCGALRNVSTPGVETFGKWHKRHTAEVIAANVVSYVERILTKRIPT